MKVLVLIPAFNEEFTVAEVARGVLHSGLDVIVVNDGSTDRTAERARSAGALVLDLPFNLGVGGALRCGFRWAVANGYEAVVQCDADGQHDPDEIHRLIDAAEATDAHLLIGSRFDSGEGFRSTWLRRIPMKVLSAIASRAAGTPIDDTTSGFRVIRQPLLSEYARGYPVHYLGDTFEVLVQAARHGYRVRQTGVTMRPRAAGESSAGAGASVRYLARAILALTIGTSHRYRDFKDVA